MNLVASGPKYLKWLAIFLCSALLSISAYSQKQALINWPNFMKNQSLHWDSISTNYYTGIILGNGAIGTNIYKEDDHSIRFDIGRSDVVDQRKTNNNEFTNILYSHPRLPIGRMILKTNGKITGASMDLDIYNAEASGIIRTSSGSVRFKALAVSGINIIYVEAEGSGGENGIRWKWIPEISISPRFLFVKPTFDYQQNPPFILKDTLGYSVCRQNLLNSGSYTTAWKIKKEPRKSILLLSVGWSATGENNSELEAMRCLVDFNKTSCASVVKLHRSWWNSFYKKSFISLPDKRMENFYWIQLYKLASATRQDKQIIDLMGPWFTSQTPWPAIWWNLNVQLTYSPIYTSNHIELGKPLNKSFRTNIKHLIGNVPPAWQDDAAAIGRISSYDLVSPLDQKNLTGLQFEPGNLTWALYYYYLDYTHTQNEKDLRNNIYPLLKRSVNYMVHLLEADSSGMLHVPLSASPEYKNSADANYTLASLRWGLETLIKINADLQLKDVAVNKWNNTLKKLVPFPVNETGFMIGKNVALTSSHRHFSHLMMIYPFHTVNWDQPRNRELITRSLEHWLSYKNALAGFTYPIAASMYASTENGDKAYQWLNELFDRYMQPNTLYKESGPVIETSLAVATAIQEMLMQSWGDKIRIFPALPSSWKEVSFDRLLADRAFLVSAKREKGATTYIKISSIKGGLCTLQTDMKQILIRSDQQKNVKYTKMAYESKSILKIETLPGEVIELYSNGVTANTTILPVRYNFFEQWSWGLKTIKPKN
jgi:alpha-L-fucosidase 2